MCKIWVIRTSRANKWFSSTSAVSTNFSTRNTSICKDGVTLRWPPNLLTRLVSSSLQATQSCNLSLKIRWRGTSASTEKTISRLTKRGLKDWSRMVQSSPKIWTPNRSLNTVLSEQTIWMSTLELWPLKKGATGPRTSLSTERNGSPWLTVSTFSRKRTNTSKRSVKIRSADRSSTKKPLRRKEMSLLSTESWVRGACRSCQRSPQVCLMSKQRRRQEFKSRSSIWQRLNQPTNFLQWWFGIRLISSCSWLTSANPTISSEIWRATMETPSVMRLSCNSRPFSWIR